MLIGVPREPKGETRVAATPVTVKQLIALGYDVVLETGAGEAASFADEAYAGAGARIGAAEQAWGADVVLRLNGPSMPETDLPKSGSVLVCMLAPALNPELVDALTARTITVLAMDAVPRISRAQSLDVLSSMANIAGYRAVIEAAHHFGRFFTGQVTAAGKVPPAKVLVAGAGVAGLAAIATAASLGAVVRATDPRPEVADQVRSLGGTYLPVEAGERMDSSDGYAKATSEAYDAAAARLYAEQSADVDIVITTALIPGRPAPRLLTAADVAAMRPGSVIVDMATAQGGNVEGSVTGEVITTGHGVTIIGYTDLAGRLAAQASQLYGTNLVNLMKLLTPDRDGTLTLDLGDVVQRGITVTRGGEKLWPPPPVQVSAATAPAAAAIAQPVVTRRPFPVAAKLTLTGLGVAALFAVNAFAPEPIPRHFTVLVLAVVIGYYVIGKVHHALHTPLMSVTNAISGVILVGAMFQIGVHDVVVRTLATVAVLLASINVFGGFAVTRRMLAMFQKGT
ncbi:Re/Si-specific NAD(P)(+) transhydrogenase subunit alpha [Winogradskya consettensis]|uniref:NAD(P) transhydrogenase subunit alpha n=1 Tax=Winogradskya consettensis TaxID=113560 RepID=A0A919SZY1_9ACTN|nr:Re/Si-specific NAD(P)(+) transhydrogenase subunit alpha [Actinoplanes consettensis]GIM82118.1 NAD(P) transhydrogenase subunit alpha [Actinoplanes consettensis]